MTEIIPAVMPYNFTDLKEKIDRVFKHTSLIQIDIMDGVFVKSKSWPYAADRKQFEELLTENTALPHWEELDFEIDLMVKNPEEVVEQWIAAGAMRIIVHVESTEKMREIIRVTKGRVEFGTALSPETPLEKVSEYLEDADFVQFMGIQKIGFQGESFDERVVDRIREFHSAHPEVIISVDGGVTFDNAPLLIEAGVKRLVSGSAIFESPDVAEAIELFKNAYRQPH